MGTGSKRSGVLYCLGDYYTGARCRLSKVRKGESCTVKAAGCPDCKLQRCKRHCKCQGTPKATGQKAPRTQDPSQTSGPGLQGPAEPPAAAAPLVSPAVGRPPSSPAVELLPGSSWLKRAMQEMQQAKSVVLASFTYDDLHLQNFLLKRLAGNQPFKCVFLVDKSKFEDGLTRYMRPRLKELQKAGGEVFLCTGRQGRGIFHAKCIIVDNKTMFSGSANLTLASYKNFDMMFRVQGPVVLEVVKALTEARDRGRSM
eukprot:12406208-Karenia_brevis.AAC.1